MYACFFSGLLQILTFATSSAWVTPRRLHATVGLPRTLPETQISSDDALPETTRRHLLSALLLSTSFLASNGPPAQALVKGNAPPEKMKPMAERPKCTNVEECQALAEQKQTEVESQDKGPPPQVTAAGTRYRDLQLGKTGSFTIEKGKDVTLLFKVLKLGKRSYDGLSGEGTVVFSRGYGLEDDEKKPGDKTFSTTVGAEQNIAALNDALVGMKVGGIRRFAVLPQKGWERPTKLCDGGPGGQGAGGELKTDYVVVPTATMVSTESCFDSTKLPFPSTYAQQRRMAQRFDQSLIMEVEVVAVK